MHDLFPPNYLKHQETGDVSYVWPPNYLKHQETSDVSYVWPQINGILNASLLYDPTNNNFAKKTSK